MEEQQKKVGALKSRQGSCDLGNNLREEEFFEMEKGGEDDQFKLIAFIFRGTE